MSQQLSNYVIETDHKIGRGSSGVVYLGHHVTTNDKVAVKKVYIGNETSESDIKLHKLWNEIKIMKGLKHPNVVLLHSVQMDLELGFLYLIMEYCDGNDLSMYIDKYVLDIDEVHNYMTQIKNGLQYLRSKGIIHRDLKPHNILIHNKQAKIADFGLSIMNEGKTNLMQTMCGSPLWMSPEIIEHKHYTDKSDLWSIGIIIYQLIYRKHPFISDTNSSFQELRNIIKKTKISYPDQPPIDSLTQDLLTGLLNKDSISRITWEDFFNHPWFKHAPNKTTTLSLDMSSTNSKSKVGLFEMSFEEKSDSLRQSSSVNDNESDDGFKSCYNSKDSLSDNDKSNNINIKKPSSNPIPTNPVPKPVPNSNSSSNSSYINPINLSQFVITDYQKNQHQYACSAPEPSPPINYSAGKLNFNSMGSSFLKYAGKSYKIVKGSIDY